MNKRIQAKLKLYKLIYSGFPTCSYAKLHIQDNECKIETDGIFKTLYIDYRGNARIINNLPDGYEIGFIGKKIYIRNLMGRRLKNDSVLFRFEASFNPKRGNIIGWDLSNIEIQIINNNNLETISGSRTKVEDYTDEFYYNDVEFIPAPTLLADSVDDNIVKGLYTSRPFPDGYTGYYHYYPDEKIFMTGRTPSNQSVPIYNNKSAKKSPRNIKALNKIVKRIQQDSVKKGLDVVSLDKSDELNTKRVKIPEVEKTYILPDTKTETEKGKTIEKTRTSKGRTERTDKGKY